MAVQGTMIDLTPVSKGFAAMSVGLAEATVEEVGVGLGVTYHQVPFPPTAGFVGNFYYDPELIDNCLLFNMRNAHRLSVRYYVPDQSAPLLIAIGGMSRTLVLVAPIEVKGEEISDE